MNRFETIAKAAETKLIARFRQNPHVFLTEEDIRSHLFSELCQHSPLNEIVTTSSNSFSSALHAEVRWYGESQKLRYRSDIVMLDPPDLKTEDGELHLPSKGYGFNKFWVTIELKLRRTNGESDKQFLDKIRREIRRMRKVQEETRSIGPDTPSFHLLCFDKKGDIGAKVSALKKGSVAVDYICSRQ